MKKVFIICCLIVIAAGCAARGGELRPEILGVSVGQSRAEAHARLKAIGRLEKEERRQQEVWRLDNDPRYTHLIVAYDKGYTGVRFVTAVADEQGRRVRYSDVLDTARARAESTPVTQAYTLDVPARDGRPAFIVRAIGSDRENLKYYSIEKVD